MRVWDKFQFYTTKIDEYELCLQWNKNFVNIIGVNMLTQLRDGVATNNTKIYLKVLGFDNLSGIQVAQKRVRWMVLLKHGETS